MIDKQMIVGWREWIHLPELGLPVMKAKIDTGAKTSCLHAFTIEPFHKNGNKWVRFGIHPFQKNTNKVIYCEAEVKDEREVSDSGGHKEMRFVISTNIVLSDQRWPIDITLSNRDSMRFRFLLGRKAMEQRIIVNPGESYLLAKPAKNA